MYNNLFIFNSDCKTVELIHDIVLGLLKDDRLEVSEICHSKYRKQSWLQWSV